MNDWKLLTVTFMFIFCISLLLNIFYLVGCNSEQAASAPPVSEKSMTLKLSSPEVRYAELIHLYHWADARWRRSRLWESETAFANLKVQIIGILEARDYYPVEDTQSEAK